MNYPHHDVSFVPVLPHDCICYTDSDVLYAVFNPPLFIPQTHLMYLYDF